MIIAHYAPSIANLRGDLIREWKARGHEVVALAPEEGFEEEVASLGASYSTYYLQRTSRHPIKDLKTFLSLMKIIKEEQPDIVFTYAVKPNLYGCLAARLRGVEEIYAMINGAGHLFSGERKRLSQRILTGGVKMLYRVALKRNRGIFFQNPEDQEAFQLGRMIPEGVIPYRIHGSGVNMERFSPREKESTDVIFLLIARLLRDKGIGEYVKAGEILKKKGYHCRLQILGPYDSNPYAIGEKEMAEWQKRNLVEYLGETKDVREYLKEASVYVLPTYYKEGVPRSILEAMAMGKAVITTDTPGCRETVIEGENGFLVKPGDPDDLAEKMEYFLRHPETLGPMGEQSRQRAEDLFDVKNVNGKILQAMELL